MSRPSPFSSWSKSVALAALLLGSLVQFASPRWSPAAAGSPDSGGSRRGSPSPRAAAAGPASPARAPHTSASASPSPNPEPPSSPGPQQSQSTNTSTADNGVAAKGVQEGPDFVQRRDEWFYGQRAYPLKQIPPGARQQAIDQMNQAIQRDIQMGVRPATSGSAAQPAPDGGVVSNAAAPGYPGAAAWTPLGPAPTNIPANAGPNLGQSATSGRITSIAVDPTNPNIVYVGSAEGGVWKTTNAGVNWTTNTDQQPSLAIGALAIDPTSCSPGPCTTIYAGTGEANFNQDAYSGAGVLKSTDGGNTWAQSSPNGAPFTGAFGKNSGGALIGALAVSPTNGQIVLAGVTGSASGIYRSTDGGQNWTLVQSGASGTAVVFDPIDGNTAYAALGTNAGSSSNGIYKSTNAGQTWTNIPLKDFSNNPIPASSIGRIALAVAPSTTGSTLTIYATVANVGGSNLLGFFTSNNGGTTWTETDPSVMPNFCVTQCWYDMAVTVNPFDPFDVIVGGSAYLNNQSTLFRNLSGGAGPWVDITTDSNGNQPHVDTHSVVWSADSSKLYIGNDGGVWRSDNPQFPSPTWFSVNNSLNISQFYNLSVHPTSDNVALGGTQDNGTQRFTSSPAWDYVTCGDGGFTIFETQVPTTVYSVCENGDIGRSFNSGVFGSFLSGFTSGIVSSDRMAFIPPLYSPPQTGNPSVLTNPAPIYFGTFRVYQSLNRAGSWSPISPDLTLGNGHITTISAFENNSNLLVVGTSDGRIWETTDASPNATWTNLNTATLPNRAVTKVIFDRRNPSILFATFSGFSGFGDTVGHVFMTTDGGVTWVDISCTVANCGTPNIAGGDLPNVPVNDVGVDTDTGRIAVATDIGVFLAPNAAPGAVWSVLGSGLPQVAVLGFASTTRSGGVLTVYTHGRGAWRFQFPNGNGPVADITSVTPPSATVGDPDTTITIDGYNFTASTVVKWTMNSTTTNLATTFISPNRMTAIIPSAQLAAANLASLSLSDPAVPFGGDDLGYVVANPMPEPAGFSTSPPGSIPVNTSFTVTATGKGFVCPGAPNNSGIRFRGTVFQPTSCTTTSITATIPAGNNNRTGQFGIRVVNGLPGGGTSNSFITVDIVPASAPPNDSISTPVVITPSATVNFSDVQANQIAATQDTGGIADPVAQCAVNDGAAGNGNTRSIWYSFTPGANGAISVDAIGSNFNAVLSSWTGAPGSLTLAAPNACSDAFSSATGVPQFTFNATSGTTYFFMLSGFGPNSGGQSVFNLVFASTGGAQFTLQPSSLTFSGQNIGTISGEQDFHVINTGSANVALTSITLTGTNPSDFILISPTDGSTPCPFGASTLAPSAKCGVGVLFYPADTPVINLNRSANATVASPSGNQNVALSGTVNSYGRLSVSPASLTFAGTLIGTTNATPQTVTVTNTGSNNLTVSGVQVNGSNSNDFATIAPTSGTNCLTGTGMIAGAACSFRVTFTPSAGGTRTAQVVFNTSGPGFPSNQQSVLLTGTGTSNSTLTITGSPATFPSTPVGSTSLPIALTFTNSSGTTPISIQHLALGGANPADFSATFSGSTCLTLNPMSIAAGTSCVINGVFQPSQPGPRSASLFINDDATNGPHTIFLSGNATGGTAAVTLSPTSLTFASQNTGTPSAPQNVVLTNIGSASLNITSISLTGTNPTDFSVAGTGSTPCPIAGGAVAAQASCTFTVIFNPQSASPTGRSATVSINESPNSRTAPDQVSLSGTAVAAPTVKFTPTSVSFGSRSVGTTSAVSNVQLQNVGTATLTAIGGATVGGANAGDFSLVAPTNGDTACTLGSNFNVNAAATCSVGVKFSPTTSGARSGAVVFITNAAGTPNTVALSGTGTGGQIFTLATSGKWETPGNWSPSGPPGPQDTAVIPSGLTVTVDATTGAASVATLTSSGTVVVSGGSLTVASGSTANVLTLSGGTLTANGAMSVSGASNLSAGALDGTGTVTFSSTLNWSGGAMTGSGSTVIGATTGVLTISGAGGKALTSRALTINGSAAVTGAGTVTVTSSVITNSATGTFDFQTDAAFSGAGTFNNAGTLKKSAGAGTGGLVVPGVGSAPAFTNIGAVQALSGTFAFQGGFAQTAGSTTVAAGAGLNTGAFTLTLTGGTLSGNGTVIGNVSNGGALNPGSSPGTFNITGNYTQTSAGILNLEFGGTTAGNFDVLAISGTATLAGTINAISFNNFTPTPGNVFQVMTFTSRSGDFTTSNLSFNGITFVKTFLNGSLSLDVAAPVVTLSSNNVTFGNRRIGTTSASTHVQLTNSGTATLNITSIAKGGTDPTQFNLISAANGATPACPLGASQLTAGNACNFDVQFAPTTTGLKGGVINVTDDAVGSPQQVSLSGTGTVPTASVPSPLAFGDRPINQKAVLPLTLTNTGSDTLNLAAATAVALSGTDAAKFSIEAGTTCVNGLAIPPAPGPGNTCVVNVGFTPDTVRNGYSATLTFTDDSGAVAGTQQLVSLTGNGVTASILLAPSPADFGNQRKGTTSAGKVITVTNSGGLAATLDATTPVSLTGTNAAEFAISASTCNPGSVLAAAPGPNNTCTVTLTFTPSGLSQRTATLNIFDSAAGSPQTDTLLGTGIAPAVVLNPTTTVSFPDQIVSTTSSAQTVTLTNNGTDTLNIATVVIDPASPNAADFAIAAGTTCTNASQVGFTAPNNTCIVNLTFTPGASGARGPAVLKFTDDANAVAGTVQQLNLQGNGLTPPTAILSTAAINFGNQRQGTTSAPQTVKITNSGTAQLSIASIIFDAASVNPGDFVLSTTGLVKPCALAGGNVAGGDFCNFNVAFGPTATGARSARVRITDNANATGTPGSTQFVDLSGTGTLPTASVPSPLAFGDRPINQKSVLPVTLTNTGTDTLNLAAAGAVALSGTDAAKFSIEAGTTCVNGLAVPPAPGPGNICVINVGFTPDTVKAGYTATLTLTDDSGGVAGTQQAVALSGNGVTASVLPTPSPVNFGNQRVGTPSAVMVVTVTNSGGQSATLDPTAPLTITGANAGDFAISLTTCAPGTVLSAAPGPNNTCTVSLIFTPGGLSLRSATLNIFDSATGSPQTDSLQGTGVAPSFAYNPTSVSFGSQIIATTSAVTNVALSNGGTDTLNVASLALTGADAAEFNLVAATAGSPQCSLAGAFQVAAGQSCVFGVSFSPLTAVGKVAAVRSTDDASGSPHDLAVTGTGVTPPTANLSTGAVPFGNQRVGTTSSTTTVTITNNGGAVLAIQSVSLDPASANPADFLLAAGAVNPCPLGGGNVAPGGNCTFTVAFKPTVQPPVAESATVNILDNANATGTPGSKQTVSLTGTGIFPAITMAPTSKDFGNQRVGTTSSPAVSFTLTNSGTDTLNISKIALDTTGNPGDFVLTAGTCNLNGGQLAASANCTLSVAFAPTATGLRSTNVVITSDVTPSVKVPLQGTGIFPAITLAPTSKDFGNQRVGTTSTPAVVVTMTNSGTDTLNFSTIALGAAGNPGDFLLAAGGGTPCNLGAGGQLAVNANCTLTVAFKPTAAGARSASVVITSDVTPSATVPLTGTGIAPAVTLNPASKAFGNQNVNTSSAVTNVTLTNSGTDTLNVSSIALAGTDTSQFTLVFQANGATAACSAAGGALAPNASCNFATKFAPTSLTPSPGKSANVTVTSDASTSPDRFTMTGTATAPVVSLSTTTVALGNAQVGDSKTGAAVTLTNTGTGPLTIATIVVGAAPPPGTGNADFTLVSGAGACANGAQIPPAPGPGNSCTLTVRLAPTATGARAAVVTLTDDDQAVANSTQTLTLSGTGVDFSVAQATPGTVQVTGGTPATVALNLTTNPSGAALPNDVNFSCASTESTLTCTANPAKITAGSTSGSTTITINSVATLLPPPTSRPDPRLFYLLGLATLAAALQVLLWRAGRRRGRRIAGLAYYLPLVLLLASLAGIAGCAGGAKSTPKGANTVTVTSTSGAVAHQTVINLNVN